MGARSRVLAYWQPTVDLSDGSDPNRERLNAQFLARLSTLGYETTVQSVHTPAGLKEWLDSDENAFQWHQDCGGIDARFIVWSNLQPTEVRFSDGEILAANDGAIILIDNLECEHRTPPPLHPERWLVRSDYLISKTA